MICDALVVCGMAAVSVAGQAPSSDENAKFLERWRAEIEGREKDPAGQVFKNHERNFASEDKRPKRAARRCLMGACKRDE